MSLLLGVSQRVNPLKFTVVCLSSTGTGSSRNRTEQIALVEEKEGREGGRGGRNPAFREVKLRKRENERASRREQK